MSIGAHNQDPTNSFKQPEADALHQGVLIPIGERLKERKEAEMLDAFYGYSRAMHDVDPRAATSEQAPTIARAAHDFLLDVADRRMKRIAKDDSKNQVPLYKMPFEPINHRITDYYDKFGTSRRNKSEGLREIEESFIEANKRPIYASVWTESSNDEDGFTSPAQKVPRHQSFPELAVGIRLEEALRKSGQEIAADSVEVVLTAYGQRFLYLTRNAAAIGIRRIPDIDAHNIRHIAEHEIPEEYRAENYRPK